VELIIAKNILGILDDSGNVVMQICSNIGSYSTLPDEATFNVHLTIEKSCLIPWSSTTEIADLPSGKHTKNDGKSPFSMGKSTISMVIFNSYVTNYQRVVY